MIVGITGTKGKTTISTLLHHSFRGLKKDVCSFTTNEAKKNDEVMRANPNMSSLFAVIEEETEFKILEATSHCLEMAFFPPKIADCVILTGIERGEHEEIHSGFDRYLYVKRKIFEVRKENALGFVCRDDPHFDELTDSVKNIVTYGFDVRSDHVLKMLSLNAEKMRFQLISSSETVDFATSILGVHNASNAAAAFLVLKESGFTSEQAVEAIEGFAGTPGRFERHSVQTNDKKKTVIIDYAHTARSLRLNLELIREVYPEATICTVFGCGGNKSTSKRPLMGEAACNLSDEVILTNDNPRREDPNAIILDIREGMSMDHTVELDRAKAIELSLDGPSELIFLAGKGSEDFRIDSLGYHRDVSDVKLLTRICEQKNFKLSPC